MDIIFFIAFAYILKSPCPLEAVYMQQVAK